MPQRRLQVELLEARYLLAAGSWEGWVTTRSDDAEQHASGSVRLAGSDLELALDRSDGQIVGIRFASVIVPQGASIQNAYLQFQVDEASTGPAALTILGQAVDDAATFNNSNGNISNRTTTNASTSWSPAPWTTVGDAGPDQRTSNISAVIQEIVDRSGWSSGNSLALIITGSGKRVAESYNGDGEGAPLLHIEYTTNGSPLAADDAVSTVEATVLNGDVLAPNPTDSDSDPDGDLLTVTAVNGVATDIGMQITLASGALLMLAANGVFAYDPNSQFESLESGQTATDTFTYQIDDGHARVDTATVTITIIGENDSPSIAVNAGTTVSEGSQGSIITSAMLNEGDPDDSGVGLTYTLTKATTNGTIGLSGGVLERDGTFTQADIDSDRISYDHDGSENLSDSFNFILADGGEDGAATTSGTFNVTVTPVNDRPTLTTFASSVETTMEDTEVEVTLAELKAQGDEADVDGTVDAFVVKSVASGTLSIGTSAATASPWAAEINDTIDATVHAYWTPGLNVNGTQNAFGVVATDNVGAESTGDVTAQIWVTPVNDIPTLSSFAAAVDHTAEDTAVELTLAELKAHGNEADVDGTVDAFLVKSVVSGILDIGTSAATATRWAAGINDTIDATLNAYWTPELNVNGTQNAFGVVATDNAGAESTPNVTTQVWVTPVNDVPTLSSFVDVIDVTAKDTEVELTLAELKAHGNEADVDGTVTAFEVKSVTTGTLKIGTSAAAARAWAAGTNDVIDATHHAYWTPAPNADGTLNAFRVVAKDDGGLESTPNVSVQIEVISDNTVPTCGVTRNVCFAVIGDYGDAGPDEADVANLVKSWTPDLIITTGDNNYSDGKASTIDANVGQYFHEYIHPYLGSYGSGADINRFFPSLGNHDWHATNAQPYLDYFTLPGNERYYDFTWGPVHFFALDSDSDEPDGNTSTSTQAQWLQNQLAASTATWKVVYMHHAPYSSGRHGSSAARQWPFKEWGATAVIAGHDHIYERIVRDGLPYFVNGLGGRSIYSIGSPIMGSEVRYNSDFGAMLVKANDTHMVYEFISRTGTVVDSYSITVMGQLPTVSVTATDPSASEFGGDTGTLTFDRTGDVSASLDVHYTVAGTAIHGSDFGALNGLATFPSGVSSIVVNVTPIDDVLVEGPETVIASLAANSSYNVGTAKIATITIEDNEGGLVEVVEARVASSSDDAEQQPDDSVRLSSSDLELTFDGINEQIVGMRFTGMNIPQGSSILNAYLQFQVDETSSDVSSLTIRGQAIDDAATFNTSRGNISNRTTTNASVTWSPAPWLTIGAAGPDQRTPDISNIIQETVGRTNWSSGNSIVIIVRGTGKRTAESFNGVKNAAPLLHVEYTTAAALPLKSPDPLADEPVPSLAAALRADVPALLGDSVQMVDLPENVLDLASATVVPLDGGVEQRMPRVATAQLQAGKESTQKESAHPVDQLLSDEGFLDLLLAD